MKQLTNLWISCSARLIIQDQLLVHHQHQHLSKQFQHPIHRREAVAWRATLLHAHPMVRSLAKPSLPRHQVACSICKSRIDFLRRILWTILALLQQQLRPLATILKVLLNLLNRGILTQTIRAPRHLDLINKHNSRNLSTSTTLAMPKLTHLLSRKCNKVFRWVKICFIPAEILQSNNRNKEVLPKKMMRRVSK